LVVLSLFLAFLGVAALPTNTTHERRARAQVFSKCTKPNTVALTFDDGPWVYLYDTVKALDAAGVKGTFFFNGNNCMFESSCAHLEVDRWGHI